MAFTQSTFLPQREREREWRRCVGEARPWTCGWQGKTRRLTILNAGLCSQPITMMMMMEESGGRTSPIPAIPLFWRTRRREEGQIPAQREIVSLFYRLFSRCSFKAGVWEGEGDVETRECWWRRKGAEQRPPRRIARSSSSQPAPATPLRCSVSSKSRFSIWIKGRSETLPFDRSNRLAPLNACSETLQLAKPSSWSSSLIADYNRWRRWQNPLLDYLLFSQYLKLMHTLLNIFTPFTPLYHWNPWKFHVSDKWLINLASFHCAYQQ